MSVRVGTPPDSRGRGPGRVAACSGPSQPSAPTATASAPASSTPFRHRSAHRGWGRGDPRVRHLALWRPRRRARPGRAWRLRRRVPHRRPVLAAADGRSAMIHFQLGDPTHLENGQIIAGQAGYVSPSARANSRAHGFPFSRTWTRQSGTGPATIDITCVSDGGDVTYVMSSGSRSTTSSARRCGWRSVAPGRRGLRPSTPRRFMSRGSIEGPPPRPKADEDR